jgi:hypothetical protein
MIKKCSKCGIEKEDIEFHKNRSGCKQCQKEYDKLKWKRYRNNPKNIERARKYRIKHREELKEKKKKLYYKKYRNIKKHLKKCPYCKEEFTTSYLMEKVCRKTECKSKLKKDYLKKFYLKNKEKIIAYNKIKYYIYKKDSLYVLKKRCRSRIADYIKKKGYKKYSSTEDMLGCNWDILEKHIEKQFKKDMNWGNREKWHIDHIIPLFLAKNYEEVLALCHYKNLQPLWAQENLNKGKNLT